MMWPDDHGLEAHRRAHLDVSEHAPLITLEYINALECALIRTQPHGPHNELQAHAARVGEAEGRYVSRNYLIQTKNAAEAAARAAMPTEVPQAWKGGQPS